LTFKLPDTAMYQDFSGFSVEIVEITHYLLILL
jgi:hypothetical protein